MIDKQDKNLTAQVVDYTKKIEERHGKGSVFLLGEGSPADINWIPFDSLKLTRLMGKGGPRGRVIEIYGPESGGKTTLATYMVAQAQKAGYTCAYLDTEQAYDPNHARNLGVDIDKLYFAQPDTTEETFSILEDLIDTLPNLGIVVIDSVATMLPQAELDGDYGDAIMGLQARLMGQALRKLKKKISKKQVMVIFINQIRMKIGKVYGNPETTTGGNALKFYASIRMDVRKKEFLGEEGDPIGLRMRVKIPKNKVSTPMRTEFVDVYFNNGIDVFSEVIDFAISYDLIKKSGAWYTVPTREKPLQGKERTIAYYVEFEKEFKELREKVYKRMGL